MRAEIYSSRELGMDWEPMFRDDLSKAGSFDAALQMLREAPYGVHFQELVQRLEEPKREMDYLGRMKVLSQSIKLMNVGVDNLDIDGKDVVFFVGPSRVGKGTLIEALGGTSMAIVDNNGDFNELDRVVMKPVHDQSKERGAKATISHDVNSHTFLPAVVYDYSQDITPAFSALKGYALVDLPGLFDTKGIEVSMALSNCIHRIIVKAKSAKCVVLLPANLFKSDNQKMIQVIKFTLSHLFALPQETVIVGVTKLHRDCHTFRGTTDTILERIAGRGESDQQAHISMAGFKTILAVEPDKHESLLALAGHISGAPCLKGYVKDGCIHADEFKQLISPCSEEEKEEEDRLIAHLIKSKEPHFEPFSLKGELTDASYMAFVEHMLQKAATQRDHWTKYAHIHQTPSLKGSLQTYDVFNDLLRCNNPAINAVIYADEAGVAQKIFKNQLSAIGMNFCCFKVEDIQQSSLSTPKKQAVMDALKDNEDRLKREVADLGWTEQEFEEYANRYAAAVAAGSAVAIGGVSFGIVTCVVASNLGVSSGIIAEGLLALGLAGPVGWILGGAIALSLGGWTAWYTWKSASDEEEYREMRCKMDRLFELTWDEVEVSKKRVQMTTNKAQQALDHSTSTQG